MNALEIIEREKLSRAAIKQHAAATKEVDGRRRFVLYFRSTSTVTELYDFAKATLGGGTPIFDAKQNGSRWRITKNAQAKRMLELLKTDFAFIRSQYPYYRQSPFFDAIASFAGRISKRPCASLRAIIEANEPLNQDIAKRTANRLNRLARCLTQYVRKARIANDNFIRNAQERQKRMHAKISAALRKRSTVTILRLDLSYKSEIPQTKELIGIDGTISRDVLRRDRAKLRAYLKDRFGNAMLDFTWNTEHGADREWHIHTLIILDAAKHQTDVLLAKQIGEEWKQRITSKRGIYWNCNADKKIYKYLAIGKVDGTDKVVQKGLRFIIAYFTLAGIFMKLDLPDQFHAFGGTPLKADAVEKQQKGRPSKLKYFPLFEGETDSGAVIGWM